MRHIVLSTYEFFSYIYPTTDDVGYSAIYIWQRRFLKSKQSKESHQSDEKADGNDFLRSLSESEGPLEWNKYIINPFFLYFFNGRQL